MNKKQLQFPAADVALQVDFTTNCGGESQNFQPTKISIFYGIVIKPSSFRKYPNLWVDLPFLRV